MNFMPSQVDPNIATPLYKMNNMDGNMVGGMPNGMRPPSSHPAGFNVMSQQMQMVRQQQQQHQQAAVVAGQVPGWQAGPNGAPMMQQPPQGPAQTSMGTSQRAMPPPSAPAASAIANGRTQTSSPQQGPAPQTPQQANKTNPKNKKDAKESKPKRATKKTSTANLNAGATPSTDAAQESATPTPATPITPVHPQSFNKNSQNGTSQAVTNGQPSAATTNASVASSQQPDPMQGGFNLDGSTSFDIHPFEFTNPGTGSMDVLQDFDFDSFLHQDTEGVDNFGFDGSSFLDSGEIGTE
jgi:hypothetical protein